MSQRKTHKLYSRWKNLRQRCNNENRPDYYLYGGRGISVCARWDNFENFVDDMMPSYQEGLTIERIDVDGDYCPENCTWISNEAQANNRRTTHYLTAGGKTMNITQWSKHAKVDRSNIYRRLSRPGLTDEQIIYGIKKSPSNK